MNFELRMRSEANFMHFPLKNVHLELVMGFALLSEDVVLMLTQPGFDLSFPACGKGLHDTNITF